MGVNTKTRRARDPAAEALALRLYCARNNIPRTALADALGTGRRYVSDVLHCDRNGKRVSGEQWERIWAAAHRIARKTA